MPAAISDPALRDQLVRAFRQQVYDRLGYVEFPHQAEWRAATEGFVLTKTVVEKKDVLPPGHARYQVQYCEPTHVPSVERTRREWRLAMPRPTGPAHYASLLAAYKSGKSDTSGNWVTGFAMIPNALVQFVGMEYKTTEQEFSYMVDSLLSSKGMRLKKRHLYFDARNGRMLLELTNGMTYEAKSWERKESLKGQQVTAYVGCEAYQLPGLETFTTVAQNLRAERGYYVWSTTCDSPWLAELHDLGHGKEPDWHCTCGVPGWTNPYCLAPNTRVLTADLRWVPVGELREGDQIAGFEEESQVLPSGARNGRHYRTATVTRTGRAVLPCYELLFEDGTRIVCSDQHMWLTGERVGGSGAARWTTTEALMTGEPNGHRVMKLFEPWNGYGRFAGYDAGYLAGAFDGEGHLRNATGTRLNTRDKQRKVRTHQLWLGFTQRNNSMLKQVRELLERASVRISASHLHVKGQDVRQFYVRGHQEVLALLGTIRPVRLLEKFSFDHLGEIRPCKQPVRVVEKTFVGMMETVTLSTSTHTLIAEGFASHNTFDLPALLRDCPDTTMLAPYYDRFPWLAAITPEQCRGLMTRERFAIAWLGQLGQYAGRVYNYQRGQCQFGRDTHPHLWTPAQDDHDVDDAESRLAQHP